MTYDPRLRVRAHDRDDPAPSPWSWYARRLRRPERVGPVGPPAPPTLARIADPEYLLDVYCELRARAGKAPGPDGVTYADLSRREVCDVMRDLGKAVLAGTYRPGPGRRVAVPKPKGGHRTLTIRDLLYRVLSAALTDKMTPAWEAVFVPWSMGFRPGRGVQSLLAEVEYKVVAEDRWVLAIDDVKKAFDFVNIDDLLADHTPYVRDEALLRLIETVLRGGDPTRTIGIDQGSAYSPTALNVRLHHAHDVYIDRLHASPPCYRYADNLVYLCRGVLEGRQAMRQSRTLLEAAGLALKGEDGPPVDLRQGEVQLLGFSLSEQGREMRYGLDCDAWEKLEQNLAKAHLAEGPPAAARVAVKGWMEAYGPAFDGRVEDDLLDRVLTTAAEYGFREIDSPETLLRRWRSSWRRWRRLRREVRHVLQRDVRSDGDG